MSRHFYRLAQNMLASCNRQDREKLESFLSNEERRQKKLTLLQPLGHQDLELLTDLLQFCDLLSLYICSGAQENVIFPEYFSTQLRIINRPDGLELDPQWISPGKFSFAALLHPMTKEVQGKKIEVQFL